MDIEEVGPSNAVQAVAAEVDLREHPSGIVPQLQNVVATINLDVKLDLKQVAMHARNAEYNPKRFAAVIMRIREPKTTALIFSSGKMVCTGARSEEDSKLAARKYCRIVQKLGYTDAKFKDFKIQNIVASSDVKFPIRLEGLAYSHGLFSSYEPEIFPGLIYRMKDPKVVLLIFVSGKVVLTGAKKRKDIYTAFETMFPVLQEFRKGDAAAFGLEAAPAAPALPAPAPAGALAEVAGPSGGMGALPPPSPSHPGARHGGPLLPPPSPMHPGAGSLRRLPPPTPSHPGMGL